MDNLAEKRTVKVIKRYTNRKLYDTSESRYVTLDEIAEIVKQGGEVQIIDHLSKKDLTTVTLAQIVFEEEKKTGQMPLTLLREIIQKPRESINSFITTQVSPRVDAIRQGAEARVDKLLGVEPGTVEFTPVALLQQSQRAFESLQSKLEERVQAILESITGNLPAFGRDLESIEARLRALEEKLDQLQSKK